MLHQELQASRDSARELFRGLLRRIKRHLETHNFRYTGPSQLDDEGTCGALESVFEEALNEMDSRQNLIRTLEGEIAGCKTEINQMKKQHAVSYSTALASKIY